MENILRMNYANSIAIEMNNLFQTRKESLESKKEKKKSFASSKEKEESQHENERKMTPTPVL